MMIRYKGFNIFAFSDTHGKHEEVQIPPDTDILICAGDVETDEYNFARFMERYSNIPALLRLFVPGNHDLSFDIYPIADVQKQIPNNVKLLLNNGFSFSGLNFYSIEARPWLHTPLSIPDSLDILVTHGAAKGYLDNRHGCSLLAEAISKHPPKVHLFGHTHECGNLYLKTDYTTYYNVSLYQDLFQQQ